MTDQSKAKLLADQNFDMRIVRLLRAKGHDITTVRDDDGAEWDDETVLRNATHDRRAVLTLNRADFVALHQATPFHYGIVVCDPACPDEEKTMANAIDDEIGDVPRDNNQSLISQLVRVRNPSKPEIRDEKEETDGGS